MKKAWIAETQKRFENSREKEKIEVKWDSKKN